MKQLIQVVILVGVVGFLATRPIPHPQGRWIQMTPFSLLPEVFANYSGQNYPPHAYANSGSMCGGTGGFQSCSNGNTTPLSAGQTAGMTLPLPTIADQSLECYQSYEAWINNSANGSTSTVYFIPAGVSNPSVVDACRPQPPYLGIAHIFGVGSAPAPDTFNPSFPIITPANSYGHGDGFRMDAIIHTNGCPDSSIQGPPFNMLLGNNGTSYPVLSAAIESTNGQPTVSYSGLATLVCVPLVACNTQNTADNNCGNQLPQWFGWD